MTNSNPTQCSRILAYMEKHGSITQLEALMELGVMRLASRISNLRKSGYEIDCEWVEVQNRFGETCRVKKYSLVGGDTNGKETRCDDLLRDGGSHQGA